MVYRSVLFSGTASIASCTDVQIVSGPNEKELTMSVVVAALDDEGDAVGGVGKLLVEAGGVAGVVKTLPEGGGAPEVVEQLPDDGGVAAKEKLVVNTDEAGGVAVEE